MFDAANSAPCPEIGSLADKTSPDTSMAVFAVVGYVCAQYDGHIHGFHATYEVFMQTSQRCRMLESVDTTIAGLRGVVGAQNDAELANKLGVNKSTVSGWRARGRVPSRYVELLDAKPIPSRDVWPELHDREHL